MPLKAARYAEGASPDLLDLIENDLPYYSFKRACEAYDTLVPKMSMREIALLGANDRFFLLTVLCNRADALNEWLYDRCREVELDPDEHLDLWARYHYKMEYYHTLTPTPDGYRKHGEILPGDYVFGPDGKPTRVIARSPDFVDGACYRVTFDKGEVLDVGADHLWTVDVHTKPRVPGAPLNAARPSVRARRTVTTRDLAAMVEKAKARSSQFFPAIPVCEPLAFPQTALPIDPYVFGVWLGDGCSTSGSITQGREDYEEMASFIRAAGYSVSIGLYKDKAAVVRILQDKEGTFVKKLKVLNVQGRGAKCIPAIYARASVEQRTALLQGLLDTDGTCDTRGTVIFCNTNERLIEDVFRLAAGLGLKPSRRKYDTTYKGEPYVFWQVAFQARQGAVPPFRLARKMARVNLGARTPRRSAYHMVVDVQPIEPVQCNCIQVEREDGLYLTGEQCIPTHNSTIITFAGSIQEIINDPEITIAIFGNDSGVANQFLHQIKQELEKNERLKDLYPDVFWRSPKHEAPVWSMRDGILVKRKGNPKENTVSAFGLLDGLPTGGHWQLLIFNDIVTFKSVTNTDTEQAKKTTLQWEQAQNLGTHLRNRRWHEGTRYSYSDSYATILERGSLKPRIYPATHDGTLHGRPVFLSPEKWAQVKNDQPGTVAAQQLLNPLAGEESTFRVEYLRPYETRPQTLNVYILGDPASKLGSKNDPTALIVVGMDPNSNFYFLDGYCHRMKLSERTDKLFELNEKWKRAPGVQSCIIGYERYGMQTDLEHFEIEARRRNINGLRIEEVNWAREGSQSKIARISRLEPDFRNSRFWMPKYVRLPRVGKCTWHIEVRKEPRLHNGEPVLDKITGQPIMDTIDGSAEYIFTPYKGPSRAELDAIAEGEGHRVLEPIWRFDSEGKAYDLTRHFFEEFRLHPFGAHEDSLDATSRVKDLDPVPPMAMGRVVDESAAPSHPD